MGGQISLASPLDCCAKLRLAQPYFAGQCIAARRYGWLRRSQPDLPNRPEALRRLAEKALAKK